VWAFVFISYISGIISISLVSDIVFYPDKIESSFFGIKFRSIAIRSISEIRKTIVYDPWTHNYREDLSVRKQGSPKRDSITGILNVIQISKDLIDIDDCKKCLMEISSANNIPITLVDPRSPPVGRGVEAFNSPLRVYEL
jgi:hypothetical protein